MEPNPQPVERSVTASPKAGLRLKHASLAIPERHPDRSRTRIKRWEGLIKGAVFVGLISQIEVAGLVLFGLAPLSFGLWAVLGLSFVAWFLGILAWCLVFELQNQRMTPLPPNAPGKKFRLRRHPGDSSFTLRHSQQAFFSTSIPATMRLAASTSATARRRSSSGRTRPTARIRRVHR
jgi:hypothetical protein